MIGKTLGHYHIPDQLGRGGMGEMCQANCDAAIRVLPDEFGICFARVPVP